MAAPEGIRGTLLGDADKSAEVRAVAGSLDDEMHMIGHEAVRKDVKPLIVCRTPELLLRSVNDGGGCESFKLVSRADGNEISVQTEVGEALDPLWSHAGQSAVPGPVLISDHGPIPDHGRAVKARPASRMKSLPGVQSST